MHKPGAVPEATLSQVQHELLEAEIRWEDARRRAKLGMSAEEQAALRECPLGHLA